jgi:hypothetical protein
LPEMMRAAAEWAPSRMTRDFASQLRELCEDLPLRTSRHSNQSPTDAPGRAVMLDLWGRLFLTGEPVEALSHRRNVRERKSRISPAISPALSSSAKWPVSSR